MQASLDQIAHLLATLKVKLGDKDPYERLRDLFDSGLLFDVMETQDPMALDRERVREILGLPRLPHPRPFQVEVNFGQNVHNLLQQVLWKYQHNSIDFPKTNGLFTAQKRKVLCVPLETTATIPETIRYWGEKSFAPAGFRETLIAATSTNAQGVYICPIPITHSAEGPTVSGVDFKYWIILRDRKGAMYLLINGLSSEVRTNSTDAIFVKAGRAFLRVKKRDLFLVMLNNKDNER